ncbi:hypothetical protein D3C84_1056430 [compost metagenome]
MGLGEHIIPVAANRNLDAMEDFLARQLRAPDLGQHLFKLFVIYIADPFEE